MPTYTYLRWYSTPTWSSFVFCMLFFRCWVPDFLFYIILALLLPRFLCFFLLVCSFVKVVKLLPLKPVASSSFWTLEKYPESQIPAKERWSSSRILSIWLPRSENVFRWVIWLPSPSMLTCRLPRKDPGRRTASNCSFLSQKNLVNSKKGDLEVEWPMICWKKSNPWKNVGGSKCHIESLFRCVWWSWQDRTNLSFWGIMIPGVIQSFMLGFFFHVKSNPQNILLFFLLFTFIVIDVGFGQIQHSKNLCVYQIL